MVTTAAINSMLNELWDVAPVTCLEVSETHALAATTDVEKDIRPGGSISGPAQFAVADSALWFLVSGAIGRVEPMSVTTELSIRFLRPAMGEQLFAEATLDKLGRATAVATVRVWTTDKEKPCAVAQGSYFIPQKKT